MRQKMIFSPLPLTLWPKLLIISIFPHFLLVLLGLCLFSPLLLIAGWCLSHPTQFEPEPPAAIHPRCALPAEGLQHSHPLPGGDAGLRPRERGQEEWGGIWEKKGSDLSVYGGGGLWKKYSSFNQMTLFSCSSSLLGFQQPWWDDFPPQAQSVASHRQQEPGQAQSYLNPPCTPLNTDECCGFEL